MRNHSTIIHDSFVAFIVKSFEIRFFTRLIVTSFRTSRFFCNLLVDPKLLATHARKAGAIAFMGMAIPFALGIAICQLMFDTLQVPQVPALVCHSQ